MNLKQCMALCAVILATSCTTDVELCSADHPHRSDMNVWLDWGTYKNLVQTHHELDSVTLLAWRRTNQMKYAYQLTSLPDAQANYVTGRLMASTDSKDFEWLPLDGENATGPQQTRLWLRSGNYQTMAYTASSAAFETIVPEGFFAEEATFENVKLTYKEYSLMAQSDVFSLPNFEKYVNWDNRNPYAGYVLGTIEPILCASGSVAVPETKSASKVILRLTPRPITQRVKIEFTLKRLEEGVQVDSIQAEMSGVASTIYLANRSLEVDKTLKVLFAPSCTTALPSTTDCAPLKMVAELDVTGLLANAAPYVNSGPGVMQVNVHTQMVNEKGQKVHRIFKTAINLYHLLQKRPSIVVDDETGAYKQAASSITWQVNAPLQITRSRVEEVQKANTDYWLNLGVQDINL